VNTARALIIGGAAAVLGTSLFSRSARAGGAPVVVSDTGTDISGNLSDKVLRARDVVQAESARRGVPPEIALSVMQNESSGQHDATGADGERGFMQLTEAAVQDVADSTGTDPITSVFDPIPVGPLETPQGRSNIATGIAYLKLQYNRLGNWFDALRAYQCGAAGARQNPNCAASEARERLRDAGRADLLP
jgi:soluble lytic murein transglycosylase-like protein